MKKVMSCELEYMIEFEYFFNKLKEDSRVDNLTVKRVAKREEGDHEYCYVAFEFDVDNFNDYKSLQSTIMENVDAKNRVSFLSWGNDLSRYLPSL